MKLFVKGEPLEVENFLEDLSGNRQYEVIAHYQEKDHFHSNQIRVGATVKMGEKSRDSLLARLTLTDGRELELKLLDGKVIEMDGQVLVYGKIFDLFA